MSQVLYAHEVQDAFDPVEASKWQSTQVSTLSFMNFTGRIVIGLLPPFTPRTKLMVTSYSNRPSVRLDQSSAWTTSILSAASGFHPGIDFAAYCGSHRVRGTSMEGLRYPRLRIWDCVLIVCCIMRRVVWARSVFQASDKPLSADSGPSRLFHVPLRAYLTFTLTRHYRISRPSHVIPRLSWKFKTDHSQLSIAHFSENWGYLSLSPLIGGNIFSVAFGRNLDAHERDAATSKPNTANLGPSAPEKEIQCLAGRVCYVDSLKLTTVACLVAIGLSIWATYRDQKRVEEELEKASARRGGVDVIWEEDAER
ncbi:hypothetical protein MPER_06122 [Moniliophthora perniciosa FA553]|nr:hypothetical protein MPER_06122 [Moniliophthora perniciosa FA553]